MVKSKNDCFLLLFQNQKRKNVGLVGKKKNNDFAKVFKKVKVF